MRGKSRSLRSRFEKKTPVAVNFPAPQAKIRPAGGESPADPFDHETLATPHDRI
jgi:hypothetical protein